ncbi:MAG: ComEC/Rec2 family competence protein [Bacteroidetes bacterium]|nr:ComEC/Rec2 family competence protein [Bacteroidota bacterium]MDA1119335.1 ComEC/Rec2 family competence protein [Bacteroidota bacterium]
MNFWSPFPFVRIFVCFSAGILLCWYLPALDANGQKVAIGAILIYGVFALLISKSHLLTFKIGGHISLLVIGFTGYVHTAIFLAPVVSEHIDSVLAYRGVITAAPEVKNGFIRAVLDLEYFAFEDSIQQTSGKVLLYIRKDTLQTDGIRYGDKLFIPGSPTEISKPTNPGGFDFSVYWGIKQIYLQDFVNRGDIIISEQDKGNPILSIAYKARDYCDSVLKHVISGKREQAIVLSLVLGIKEGLDNDLKDAYASAGAMHVLAVSGLHVGILYLFILYLLRPIRYRKYGDLITGVVSLFVLWFYALVTGMSPSVLRAVIMFTVFIIGRMFRKSRNIYNSLAVSALILLIINPLLVFDIGFQLSYLAVFGIVFLQPRLYRLWSPDSWLVNKGWELTCVSLAAQIATFPLGLYYFHQFPTFFLISNLAVIPVAFSVLVLGILIILTSVVVPLLSQWLGLLVEWVVSLLNQFVFIVDGFELSLIASRDFSVLQIFLIYISLAAIWALLVYRKLKYLMLTVIVSVIFTTIETFESFARSNKNEIVFYDFNGYSAIDFRSGHVAYLFTDADSTNRTKLIDHVVSPDRIKSGLPNLERGIIEKDQWAEVFGGIQLKEWQGRKFIRLFSSDFHKTSFQKKIETDYLVVSNNSVTNLEQILDRFEFNLLVLDGSNDYGNSYRIFKSAKDQGLIVHSTRLDGALILDL